MSSERPPQILLFGAGSIGTVYLWLLSKVASTTAVCRSNYETVKQKGFTLNSEIYGQGLHFKPHVVRTCEEAASTATGPYDYVIVCSKAIPHIIPALIKPTIKPGHTVIVLIQNGVGIEEEHAAAFPNNPVISAAVYMPASQRELGVITHGELELLQVGSYPSNASSHHAETFAALLHSAGGTVEVYDDIQSKRWFKLLINASWNPICALSLSKDTDILACSPEATNVVLETMLEIAHVATAMGYKITREEVEFQLGRAQARIPIDAGIEPSMLQDARAGRRIEVEAICGNIVRMARGKGVQCVRLEMLYVLAKALDLEISRR